MAGFKYLGRFHYHDDQFKSDVLEDAAFTFGHILKDATEELENTGAQLSQEFLVDSQELMDCMEGYIQSPETLDSEAFSMMMESLCNVLNESGLLPPYLSAYETPHGEWGIWVDADQIREDLLEGELADRDVDVDDGFEGVAVEVNDHGNMTLWKFTPGNDPVELWGLV